MRCSCRTIYGEGLSNLYSYLSVTLWNTGNRFCFLPLRGKEIEIQRDEAICWKLQNSYAGEPEPRACGPVLSSLPCDRPPGLHGRNRGPEEWNAFSKSHSWFTSNLGLKTRTLFPMYSSVQQFRSKASPTASVRAGLALSATARTNLDISSIDNISTTPAWFVICI